MKSTYISSSQLLPQIHFASISTVHNSKSYNQAFQAFVGQDQHFKQSLRHYEQLLQPSVRQSCRRPTADDVGQRYGPTDDC